MQELALGSVLSVIDYCLPLTPRAVQGKCLHPCNSGDHFCLGLLAALRAKQKTVLIHFHVLPSSEDNYGGPWWDSNPHAENSSVLISLTQSGSFGLSPYRHLFCRLNVHGPWSRWLGSNQHPAHYKWAAPPVVLHRHIKSKTVCPLTTTPGNCDGSRSLLRFVIRPKVEGIRTLVHFAYYFFRGAFQNKPHPVFPYPPPALLSAIMGDGIMRKVNVFADTPTEHFPSKILYIFIYIL